LLGYFEPNPAAWGQAAPPRTLNLQFSAFAVERVVLNALAPSAGRIPELSSRVVGKALAPAPNSARAGAPPYRFSNPRSNPRATASARSAAFSFNRSAATCALAVRSVMPR